MREDQSERDKLEESKKKTIDDLKKKNTQGTGLFKL